MSTILIAGGTGLIGRRLTEMLCEHGHEVRVLSRHALRNPVPQAHPPSLRNRVPQIHQWNPAAGTVDDAALLGTDVIINLAGAGIADRRWTDARKRELVQSRVQSAQTLGAAIERTGHKPQVYLATSAIGYYGDSGERWMHETDSPVDQSFMVECCREWEQATAEIAALGIRTAVLRIGVVLAGEGGALAEFVKPLRFGLGAYFADGQAWYSWIHRDDVCRIFLWAMGDSAVSGVFNAVAPQPVRNLDLVRATARAMRQRAIFAPAPAFVMRLIFGEMSAVILNSNRVSSDKLLEAGFRFQHPELAGALGDIFSSSGKH